jgi:hypothetical protein
VAHGEFLVLSNTVGIYFPQAVEVPTALSSASSRTAPAPIGLQPIQPWKPVHSRQRQTTQEEIYTAVGRIGGWVGIGKARNQRVGRQPIRRAAEVATSPTRQSSPTSSCMKTTSLTEGSEETEGSETRTIFQMTTTRTNPDMTPTCSRSVGKMTSRIRKVR